MCSQAFAALFSRWSTKKTGVKQQCRYDQHTLKGSQPRLAGDAMIVDLHRESYFFSLGFWKRFCTEESKCQYTEKKQMLCWQALSIYIQWREVAKKAVAQKAVALAQKPSSQVARRTHAYP